MRVLQKEQNLLHEDYANNNVVKHGVDVDDRLQEHIKKINILHKEIEERLGKSHLEL